MHWSNVKNFSECFFNLFPPCLKLFKRFTFEPELQLSLLLLNKYLSFRDCMDSLDSETFMFSIACRSYLYLFFFNFLLDEDVIFILGAHLLTSFLKSFEPVEFGLFNLSLRSSTFWSRMTAPFLVLAEFLSAMWRA